MQMCVIPDSTMRAILTDIAKAVPGAAAAGPLDGAKLKLSTADFTPTRLTVLGDFVAPTFTGYAASSAIAWGLPLVDEDGRTTISGGSKQFTCTTAPDEAETVHCWYITDGAGAVLLCSGRLTNPLVINTVGDGIVLVPEFHFPFGV